MDKGLAKYRSFTKEEREAFYQKHGLSSHPDDDLIDLARHDIEWCLRYGSEGLDEGDLDWLIPPLEDLGETQLLGQIMKQKKRLGI